jgi:hypothetical protein
MLTDASKEVGLEMSVEKTKYMLLSRQQNVGQNRDIKIANRSFENVSQFKYLGTTVTNCLLPFGPAPSVFSSAVEKRKNWNIQDHNFACGSVWVLNLVSDSKGGT